MQLPRLVRLSTAGETQWKDNAHAAEAAPASILFDQIFSSVQACNAILRTVHCTLLDGHVMGSVVQVAGISPGHRPIRRMNKKYTQSPIMPPPPPHIIILLLIIIFTTIATLKLFRLCQTESISNLDFKSHFLSKRWISFKNKLASLEAPLLSKL